jgi:S-adenosylmethionine:tRNA ribosyltransferase-isomerase
MAGRIESMPLRTDDFDYALPAHLIAQDPAAERDKSRLLVLDRASGSMEHRTFRDLPSLLRPGDLLVANRTRVLPARLLGHKKTGGAVELLLLRRLAPDRWTVMARPSRRLSAGTSVALGHDGLEAELLRRTAPGEWEVIFSASGDLEQALRKAGRVPLPPYIGATSAPPERYQTVYADREGSVAAPTAGLHFTPSLLDRLRRMDVGVAYVTLHVGPGTFRPVTTDRVEGHRMDPEWGEVTPDVASTINEARAEGGRIVAVGTTTTRLLETAGADGAVAPFCGETDRFIYPGYRFSAIDALITNFHLPRSTLLMLVSALAGRELILEAYGEAIARSYRFYSFGDAMLIL